MRSGDDISPTSSRPPLAEFRGLEQNRASSDREVSDGQFARCTRLRAHAYRAFLVGPDGHAVQRMDLYECADADVAKAKAQQLVDNYAVELWDGDRKIALFEK